MKVLVTVASRHGATWEIGEVVADALASRGFLVDQAVPEEVEAVDDYDAVVLGSAVYLAHWIPAAREFADRFSEQLRAVPVWMFSSGLATQPAASANSPQELIALRDQIGARGHRSFRGRLDRQALSFAERAAIAGARAREGDHRDLAAVRAWALGVADDLATCPTGVERPSATV